MFRSNQSHPHRQQSWFNQNFLNNRWVTTLLIILLVMINIMVFTRIAYLFSPVKDFFSIVGLPLVGTGALYYLFSPLVNKLVRRGLKKSTAIALIFIIALLLIIWGASSLFPIIKAQTTALAYNWPRYVDAISELFNRVISHPALRPLNNLLSPIVSQIDLSRLTGANGGAFNSLGSLVGTVTQVTTGIVVIPVLLYYLLLEDYKIPQSILHAIPSIYRKPIRRIMVRTNQQIAQYVRGQIIVAICVAIMFMIGFSIIGLDYGITIGILAGFLNIIPIIGSMLAAVPALIIGLITSPLMFLKVVIVLALEQTIEGRILSPQVLGSSMEIHPVTILLVLLAGGKMFGLAGVILAVPGYAVLKVLFDELFSWYRIQSDLYEDEETPMTPPEFYKENLPVVIEEHS